MKLIGLLGFCATAGLVWWGINTLSGAYCVDNSGRVILYGVLFGLGIFITIIFAALLFSDFEIFEKIWGCGLGLILTAGCIAAMFYFGSQRARLACPAPEIYSALSSACRGNGNPQAGSTNPTQAGGYKVVVMNMQSEIYKDADRAPAAWKPAALADSEFVLCLDGPKEVFVNNCNYAGGSDIERYRKVINAVLISARTGERVTSKTFTCQPRACLSWELSFIGKISCKVKVDEVFDWFETFLSKWRVAASNEPGKILLTPSPTLPIPTLTAAKSPTPRPSLTPQPLATVKSSSIRVRSAPNTNSTTLAGLRQGDQVKIIGCNAGRDWVKAALADGQQGWIMAELLTLPAPIESLSVIK